MIAEKISANDSTQPCLFRLRGLRVDDPTDLERAVRKTRAREGPALLDVATAKSELVAPPKVRLEQAKGFGLYMLKAVLSGRGDEVIDLADVNLRR